MNEQTKTLIRQVLQFLGGTIFGAAILARFGITAADLNGLVEGLGALATAGAAIWAVWSRRKKAIVASAAEIVPVPAASQAKVGIEVPIAPSNPPAKASI